MSSNHSNRAKKKLAPRTAQATGVISLSSLFVRTQNSVYRSVCPTYHPSLTLARSLFLPIPKRPSIRSGGMHGAANDHITTLSPCNSSHRGCTGCVLRRTLCHKFWVARSETIKRPGAACQCVYNVIEASCRSPVTSGNLHWTVHSRLGFVNTFLSRSKSESPENGYKYKRSLRGADGWIGQLS